MRGNKPSGRTQSYMLTDMSLSVIERCSETRYWASRY